MAKSTRPSFAVVRNGTASVGTALLLLVLLLLSSTAVQVHGFSICAAPTTRHNVAYQCSSPPLLAGRATNTICMAAADASNDKNGNSDKSNDEVDRDPRATAAAAAPTTEILDVVMKFGGSSLANADRLDHVAHLIKSQIESQNVRPRAVVCSAMGKTTNDLLIAGDGALHNGKVCMDAILSLHETTLETFGIDKLSPQIAQEVRNLLGECNDLLNGVRLIQELSPKTLDQLVSYGERCSVRIMAARLQQIGVPAQAYDSWDVGFYTDSNFGDAKLLPNTEESIRNAFDTKLAADDEPNVVAVVTGFIGHDPAGKVTTLGRGGSDLTATAIGAALALDEVQVWKDVDGILSSDPKLVPHAVPINRVSYEEASELAYFGAQVLHPIAMQPTMKHNVPVRVKNSYNPAAEGTVITQQGDKDRLVTAITYKRDITLMDIQSTQMLGCYGFLAKVFGDFETHKLSVDVLASSEVSVSLTLDQKQDRSSIQALVRDMSPYAQVTLHQDRSILTLITDVERSSEVLATVFQVFSMQHISVEMMSQGASKVNISFIVHDNQLEDAVLHLHKCFFEDKCVVPVKASAVAAAASSLDEANGQEAQSNFTLVEVT